MALENRCTSDADCTFADIHTSCVARCNDSAVVSTSSAGLVPLELQRVEATYCAPFAGRPCAGPFPPGCPFTGESFPSCQAGRCTAITPP